MQRKFKQNDILNESAPINIASIKEVISGKTKVQVSNSIQNFTNMQEKTAKINLIENF